MKIAYIVPSLANKGPVKVVHELVQQLKNDHDIHLFYFSENKGLVFDIPVNKIDFFTPIDFDDFDIIHTHGIRPDAYIYYHRKRIKKAKTVTTLHNYVKQDLRYQYNPFVSYLFSHLWNLFTSQHDQVITLSKDAVAYYQHFWFNKSISYVYNGIAKHSKDKKLNPTLESKLLALKNEYTLIGAIGLLTKRKGFDQAIRALQDLPSYALVIVGEGKEANRLKQLCHKYNVDKRILFVGFESNVDAVIQLMDVMVIPSRSEGFSLVLQETARQKKAVVCSDIPIFHELFSNNEVLFFDLENIQMLTDKIILATENKEHLGEQLNSKFLTTYTSAHMAQNYLKHYQSLVEEK